MDVDEVIRKAVEPNDDRELAVLRDVCGALDITMERASPRGVDPGVVWLLVGPATLVYLAIERWQDRRAGGQVIDARPGADPVAYRDPGVMFGLVVIYGTDGTVQVQVKEPTSQLTAVVRAVVEAVAGGGAQQVEQISSLVRGTVGDLVQITQDEAERPAAQP